MASKIEELYLHLPVWAQNLALDFKGRSERRIRFGGDYVTFASEVERRRTWSLDQLRQFQLAAVNELIATAQRQVPVYRELYRPLVESGFRLQSLADIGRLPIVDKVLLRSRNRDFLDESHASRDVVQIKTTGTTGSPVVVYTTPAARQLNYAYYNDFLKSVGLNPFGRRAVVGGRIILSAAQTQGPFWRVSRSMNTMYLSSYHISRENVAAYARAIEDWSVEYYDAYPSSMWLLAELFEDAGIRVKPPKAIITSAETLYPEQRELIERVFQAPIHDQYGAAEMCMFVAQCTSRRYHVRPDYGVIEIMKDGRDAVPGETGEVLCTGFVNHAMPLIRYRIGDMAAWALDQSCNCGSSAPMVQQIEGRQDDLIICPDGRRIGRLSPVLKGFPVREAQYVQRKLGSVVVRLVKEASYSDRDTAKIQQELRKRLGDDMEFEFEFVDALPRGAGGKLRAVICEIGRESRLA